MRTPSAKLPVLWIALVVLLSGCSEQSASVPADNARAEPAVTRPTSRVFVDPATGQLREPTAAELADIARQESAGTAVASVGSAKPAAPTEVRYPDGTVGIAFGNESLAPLHACIDPDGAIDEHCSAGVAAPKERGEGRP